SSIFPNRYIVHCQAAMTIPVSRRALDAAVRERGSAAYVLTVSDRGMPHVVQAEIIGIEGGLVAEVGAHSADNARARPGVCVLYPSRGPTDYSLIVDALATVEMTQDGPRLLLAPTRAVLHRRAPAFDAASSPCGSDCLPLAITKRDATGSAGTDA